jgi:IMP dehydrogenase
VALSPDIVDMLEARTRDRVAVTFDELTLEDKPSSVHPNDVVHRTFITARIRVRTGILSAPMDTVTEPEMALAMAKMGGVGIIHRNVDTSTQVGMVKWVRSKIFSGGMIDRPICFQPDQTFADVQDSIQSNGWTFTSFPVTEAGTGRLLGLLTRDEMDFVENDNPRLDKIMKPITAIVSAPVGTSTDEAYRLMTSRHVKKLPIVDDAGAIAGMYVWGDVRDDQRKRATFSLDEDGHFLVGAAIGLAPSDVDRARQLVEAGCRLIVMDSSHGACQPAVDILSAIKAEHGHRVQIILGNIASYESAMFLLRQKHIPDALRVGVGCGSICTTRIVTGHGVPQVTAVFNVWRAVRDSGLAVPVIADGGIRSSGDIVKALAVGASAVMLGSVLAGTDEAPGRVVQYQGKKFKQIRGMGSRAAMAERSGSRARYSRDDAAGMTERLTVAQKEKMVPEGVEGLVELKGSVEKVVSELCGGISSGLAHSGAQTIVDFQQKASAWIQGQAGITEGKPHSLHDIRG